MFASVEVNLLTGVVNYDRVDGSVILSNEGGANADWKVAPQDLTAGAEWLRITVGEDVWYYHVPADLNTAEPGNQTRLESGKRLTLNLKLKKNPARATLKWNSPAATSPAGTRSRRLRMKW